MPHQLQYRAILAVHQRPRAKDKNGILVLAGFPRMRAGNPNALPFHACEEFPPVQRRGVRFHAARLLPYCDCLFARNQTAAAIVLRPAPDAIEAPAQILERIAKVRHFPIEDAMDAPLLVVEKIACSVVSMHDAYLLRGRRRIAAHPSNRGTHYRLRNQLVGVENPLPIIELTLPALIGRNWLHRADETQLRGILLRDLAEDRPLLPGDLLMLRRVR